MPRYTNREYDIEKAFRAIEDELMASMIRNLENHRAEETKEGYNWSQWQVKQLASLEKYKKNNRKKFQKKFSDIREMIKTLISQARSDGGMEQEVKILKAMLKGYQPEKVPEHIKKALKNGSIEDAIRKNAQATTTGEFFDINTRKLDALINATQNDLGKAEHAMLRMADDQYRKIIFNAQVYANTGAGTYEKAVDMATKDFLAAGINCIEYKNGSRHTIEDYADMCIRTATKRAYLTGEGEKRKEWGETLVRVNKRGNPCPKCLPFVGKVLIDDVWSGGKASDGPYPLISRAMEMGLYHPRCKDIHSTYFKGISSPPEPYTKEELAKISGNYKAEQEQKVAKHNAKKYERLAKYSLDEGNKSRYSSKMVRWKTGIEDRNTYSVDKLESQKKRKIIDVTKEYLENARPGIGTLTFEDGTELADRETTRWLHNLFGGDIKCLKEDSNIGKMQDALWNGIYWEFKSPTSLNAIEDRIKKANRQLSEALNREKKENAKRGMVIDISGLKLPNDDAINKIIREMNGRFFHETDVIVKKGNEVIKILQIKE